MLKHPVAALFSPSAIIAWIGFFMSLGVTLLLWINAREDALMNGRKLFVLSAMEANTEIINRMSAYENILHSGAAFLNTVERMNREKWRIYITSLDITKHYPGFQGIGFSKRIPPADLPEHIKKMRAEGFTNYTIKPQGKRDEYHPIIYLEPLNERNLRTIGYDMFSNPVRQDAMIRARDTAQVVISDNVTLVQETSTDVQTGFLMYLPFYHTEKTPLSQHQRREHLKGFVYAPFRIDDLMKEILVKKNSGIALKLYHGPSINEKTLFYESSPGIGSQRAKKPLFEKTFLIHIYGRTWTAVYQTLPLFEKSVDHKTPRLILLAGLPISFLLLMTILFYSQITQRARIIARKMTTKIRTLNEELETMINAAPSPIIVHTENGTIVKLNQAWSDATGYTHEELLTTDTLVEKLFRDEEQQIYVKKHIRTLYSIIGKVDEGEFTFYSQSGRKMIWQFSSAPFGLIQGKRAIITSAMDITELKNKDAMMIIQSRHAALGEMISMIAHQWRQPLASISTVAGTLSLDVMMDNYNKDFFQERLNAITELALDLSSTINDFRNFLTEEKSNELTTWKSLLEACLVIIEPILKAKNIKLHFVYEEDIPFLTHTREMKQVILNILQNSKDVLVDNKILEPQIWIYTAYKNGKACLEIEDNGGGIPNKILHKIFDPYFSTKMDKDGTGIGLYMSKIIVEQHCKGQIKVHNTKRGATFKIVLPAIDNMIVGS